MSEPRRIEQSDKEASVLKAATEVFLAHGFSAATTDMIQRRAGVSKATMYGRFPNKEPCSPRSSNGNAL
ncbi:helix-turn-helix domain-containing protein [Ralstonia solanacearum]|uniref:helix-turn-helix domain-containing protein n=1 Tax=Ralstonia solanacearum TaxID=305 RepID=UPI000AF058E9